MDASSFAVLCDVGITNLIANRLPTSFSEADMWRYMGDRNSLVSALDILSRIVVHDNVAVDLHALETVSRLGFNPVIWKIVIVFRNDFIDGNPRGRVFFC